VEVSVGDRDDFVRRYELDKVERAVEELRAQQRDDGRRYTELREADKERHAAEHDAIESRIERERERHQREHEAEERERQHRGEWTWTRVMGVVGAILVMVGLEFQYIAAHK
jgi:hypothetical protein